MAGQSILGGHRVAGQRPWAGAARWGRTRMTALLVPLAQPLTAGLLALVVYLLRASMNYRGFATTDFAYFNYLADGFLHGQLSMRQLPPNTRDLIPYMGNLYLYWPPFPAILLLPVVAIWGVAATDVTYTAIIGAITVALTAKLLAILDRHGVAPLAVERRALLVLTVGCGSVVLILAPVGSVWFTAQLIGFGCVLLATIAAIGVPDRAGYFLTGLALGCALATRNSLLFNGVWLAYFMLRRDWAQSVRERAVRVAWGLGPVLTTIGLLLWYNWARFGSPTETGLKWHNVAGFFAADFARYGVFNTHYLLTNLREHFWTYPVFTPREEQRWLGGGLFWMSPILLAAPWAILQYRRDRLIWAMVLSCLLVYIPIGLLMGTGWVTYGPRYLLDLLVPILVLAALGLRRWPLVLAAPLALVGCATYILGSQLWMLTY